MTSHLPNFPGTKNPNQPRKSECEQATQIGSFFEEKNTFKTMRSAPHIFPISQVFAAFFRVFVGVNYFAHQQNWVMVKLCAPQIGILPLKERLENNNHNQILDTKHEATHIHTFLAQERDSETSINCEAESMKPSKPTWLV